MSWMLQLCEWFEVDGATRMCPVRSTARVRSARTTDSHDTLLRGRIDCELNYDYGAGDEK